MNRWLLIGSLAGMMFAFSGCCSTGSNAGCSGGGGGIFGGGAACGPGCSSGQCGGGGGMLAGALGGGGGCKSGACGGGMAGGGLGGRAAGLLGMCSGGCGPGGCGRTGCRAGALGWQSGGLDYSSHLQSGMLGHTAAQNLNSRQFTPGPPTGQVAYPYYTVRGPRDFLVDNPPTIGR